MSVQPLVDNPSSSLSQETAKELIVEKVTDVESLLATLESPAWGKVFHADNMEVLSKIQKSSINLIYIDPPFNTGKSQIKRTIKTQRINGKQVKKTRVNGKQINGVKMNGKQIESRIGFGDKLYAYKETSNLSYQDSFSNYLAFLRLRLDKAWKLLADNGSLFVHLDSREVHRVKVMMDRMFGRESFINEIIWAYDYGGRSRSRWSSKHDTILFYAKNPDNYVFNYEAIDRIPYMAPLLVGPEKAKRGKTPTDVWWHTIVPTNGKEKTGYPTQKPLGIIERIVKVHSNENDIVMDFFAGSGTIGEACVRNNRRFILVDNNQESIDVIKSRLINRCKMEMLK